ncbi:MAG: hypothetical protein D3920_02595 [Candidatus Electrothrix sp. AW2]|nr:hypothetical protein [Candidatus Electrothrix gigas]
MLLREQLLAMCRNIYANLKEGGRFLTVNGNFDESGKCINTQQYGLPKLPDAESRYEGMPRTVTFTDKQGRTTDFTVYYFSQKTYRWAFKTAGFREIRWHGPKLSPEGLSEFGQEFWQNALEHPIDWYIECIR